MGVTGGLDKLAARTPQGADHDIVDAIGRATPAGLVPLVKKIDRLKSGSPDTADPHLLVTWVKKMIGLSRTAA